MRNTPKNEISGRGKKMTFKKLLHFFLSLFIFIIYSSIISADDRDAVRGAITFRTYCKLCHGKSGKGDGPLAVNKMPKPANLTQSILTNEQKRAIIKGGGQSVGRSPFMPPWGEELSEQEINDLLAYLKSINMNK